MNVRIEMLIPDGVDLSDLLERMQAFAVELTEEVGEENEDGEPAEIDPETISANVSVQAL